jgi:hypothetical protein
MNTITNEHIVAFDVDGTLVSLKRYRPENIQRAGLVEIINPYVNEPRFVKVHTAHVQLLNEMYRQTYVAASEG